ncbi:hypothetical protein [Sphingobacterium athyrii]|uniref:hypothetical protein n=1 Tax=Sphingobacterium athyrii TaxID=2152717 RepID=UPI0015E86EB5|nr:hypothetical protein [Sphingobacterium athyrii]
MEQLLTAGAEALRKAATGHCRNKVIISIRKFIVYTTLILNPSNSRGLENKLVSIVELTALNLKTIPCDLVLFIRRVAVHRAIIKFSFQKEISFNGIGKFPFTLK